MARAIAAIVVQLVIGGHGVNLAPGLKERAEARRALQVGEGRLHALVEATPDSLRHSVRAS
ncbi:MAG: hypothetical protein AB1768_11960 [Pseudomonadota bacterium]|jgi:hypothetical protein